MKIKVSLGIGLVGCNQEDEIEIEDSELEGMAEDKKEEYFEEIWRDWAWNHIDGYHEVIE